jgi:hypothetical protein
MSNIPPPRFFDTFTPRVAEALVHALAPAYELASDHFDESQGSDNQLFGFEVYKFGSFQLEKLAERKPQLGLEVISAHPIFRLGINGYELASHRVGSHASDDINHAFPGNDGAVLNMVESFLPFDQLVERASRLVLAHLGNHEDGLTALYVCIPAAHDGEHITGWAYTHRLWVADDGPESSGSVHVAPTPPAPPEIILPAAARLRAPDRRAQ